MQLLYPLQIRNDRSTAAVAEGGLGTGKLVLRAAQKVTGDGGVGDVTKIGGGDKVGPGMEALPKVEEVTR